MYIVCITVKIKKKNLLPYEYENWSDYTAVETLNEARFIKNNLLEKDSSYSITICKPIESTEAHYIEENK